MLLIEEEINPYVVAAVYSGSFPKNVQHTNNIAADFDVVVNLSCIGDRTFDYDDCVISRTQLIYIKYPVKDLMHMAHNAENFIALLHRLRALFFLGERIYIHCTDDRHRSNFFAFCLVRMIVDSSAIMHSTTNPTFEKILGVFNTKAYRSILQGSPEYNFVNAFNSVYSGHLTFQQFPFFALPYKYTL